MLVKRYSARRMSRPNRDKALKRLHGELMTVIAAAPTAPDGLALQLQLSLLWRQMEDNIRLLWGDGRATGLEERSKFKDLSGFVS